MKPNRKIDCRTAQEYIDASSVNIKILTVPEHRKKMGDNPNFFSGYNIVASGKIAYDIQKQILNIQFSNDDFEHIGVKPVHPIPGYYKIIKALKEPEKSYIPGMHHVGETLLCLYNCAYYGDFLAEEPIKILTYTLWHAQSNSDVDELHIGDIFRVDDFKIEDNRYTVSWHVCEENMSAPVCSSRDGYVDIHPIKVNTKKTLLNSLKELRAQIAEEHGIELYQVAPNRTIEELAKIRPTTKDELSDIWGLGPAKINKYGSAFLSVIKAYSQKKPSSATRCSASSSSGLRDELVEFRRQQASREQIPPYCIFSNKVLDAIVDACPADEDELLDIFGMGPAKVEKYGDQILEIIERYQ